MVRSDHSKVELFSHSQSLNVPNMPKLRFIAKQEEKVTNMSHAGIKVILSVHNTAVSLFRIFTYSIFTSACARVCAFKCYMCHAFAHH